MDKVRYKVSIDYPSMHDSESYLINASSSEMAVFQAVAISFTGNELPYESWFDKETLSPDAATVFGVLNKKLHAVVNYRKVDIDQLQQWFADHHGIWPGDDNITFESRLNKVLRRAK